MAGVAPRAKRATRTAPKKRNDPVRRLPNRPEGTAMSFAAITDRRAFIRAGGVAALGALSPNFLGSPALAQQKLTLKASDVHPEGYPTVAAVENLGKKLESATQGRI